MTITANHVWPDLPLPFLDYSGQFRMPTMISQPDASIIVRRARYHKTYASVQATWKFTLTDYDSFEDFVATDLGNGTAAFLLPLRYPKNSELASWLVRFAGEGWDCINQEQIWEVNALLDLIESDVLPDQAAVIT